MNRFVLRIIVSYLKKITSPKNWSRVYLKNIITVQSGKDKPESSQVGFAYTILNQSYIYVSFSEDSEALVK